MFTGIIEETGVVENLQKKTDGILIQIKASEVLGDLKSGDSICVNGVCQTVMQRTPFGFEVFSIPATLAITNFRYLKEGDLVNLERALKVQDRWGGHFVQGHVEGVGEVLFTEEGVDYRRVAIRYNSPYLIPKGSIAVNGISLTLQKVEGDIFWVELIPETLKRTNSRFWKKGDLLNIETDFLVKVVDHLLQVRSFSR